MTASKVLEKANDVKNDLSKLDPEPLLVEVARKSAGVLKKANEFSIRSKADMEEAGELAGQIGTMVRSVDAQRAEFIAPILEAQRRINARFKAITDPLSSALAGLKAKIAVKWAAIRAEDEAKAAEERKRLEKLHERRVDRAEAAGREPPPPPPMPVAATQKRVGSATVREEIDYEVVDMKAIPERFLEIKRGPLLAALRQGEDVPGVKKIMRQVVAS